MADPSALAAPLAQIHWQNNSASTEELFTPARAAWWLAAYRYDRQRPVRINHATRLARYQTEGTWKPSTIELAVLGERGYLIDGQHTLTSVTLSGITLATTVKYHYCTTEAEVHRLYELTDHRLGRTRSDVWRARDLADQTGLNNKQMTHAAAAARWIAMGFRDVAVLRKELVGDAGADAERVLEWAAETREFFELMRGGEGLIVDQLMRRCYMSVALVTLRHQPVIAAPFWSQIAQNDLQSQAARLLYRSLTDVVRSTKGRPRSYTIEDAYYSRRAAVAWNAAFHKRALRSLPTVQKDGKLEAIRILGTPFGTQGEDE